MRKEEYLRILSDRLSVLQRQEYKDIMEYYEEYFEDAGDENTDQVICELGDVNDLADKILRENDVNLNDNYYQQYNHTNNYTNNQPYNQSYNRQNNKSYGQPYEQSYNYPEKKGLSTGVKVAIAIVTFPIWIGIVGTVFGLVVGFGGASLGCFAASVAVFVAALTIIFESCSTGIACLGAAFIVLAVACLLAMGCVGIVQLITKVIKYFTGRKNSQNIPDNQVYMR